MATIYPRLPVFTYSFDDGKTWRLIDEETFEFLDGGVGFSPLVALAHAERHNFERDIHDSNRAQSARESYRRRIEKHAEIKKKAEAAKAENVVFPETSPKANDQSKDDAGKGRTPGPTVSKEDIENRKLVVDRWEEFKNCHKKLGFNRATYQNAAKWMTGQFDMPFLTEDISDPTDYDQIGKKIKEMIRAYNKTPTPKAKL